MSVTEQKEQAGSPATVHVVDDDPAVRDALSSLLRSVGLNVMLYASAAELLQGNLAKTPGCLVLDIRLPGVSGLEFQTHLARSGVAIPIIFMTGHGDVPMSVRAMKAGAVDFLTKPFRDQDMLDSVFAALSADCDRRQSEGATLEVRERYETLTPRERQVMTHVVKGLMNKQIAAELGLSEITVKIHRGQVMKKMLVRTLADLVRAGEKLKSPSVPS